MLAARHDLPLCRTVARQLISDHDARRPALALQQLAEQALGGALITPALDQHIEHDAVLIDRTPEPVLLAGDLPTTSSKCHLSPDAGRRRRIWLANAWPNLSAHCRTLSWLTMMPRAASISSTMRKLSGKRKYSHTAWLITSGGKR